MISGLHAEIKGSSVLILGYGREGQCVHRFLLRHAPWLLIDIADKREFALIKDAPKDTKTFFGPDYLSAIERYDTIIRSPGISPLILPPAANLKQISSLSNIFMALCPGLTIGVTGTKGKSTSSSLIHYLLSSSHSDVRLVGNIGKPALDHLENSSRESIFVIELSSFQLEDLRYSPNISVILEVFPEHLDHHGSLDNYLKAKFNIAKFQAPGSHLVIHYQHHHLLHRKQYDLPHLHYFGLERGKDMELEAFIEDEAFCLLSENKQSTRLMRIGDMPLLGKGNLNNALAAIITAKILDVPALKIVNGLSSFSPLEHRLEKVGEYQGITFYNDSLSTIPQAAENALEALGSEVETIILGGNDRGIDYSVLAPVILRSQLKTLILFPTTGEKVWKEICRAAGNESPAFRKFNTDSMEEAVRIAYRETAAGKICLMSPAASSMNLFRDYQERGEAFKSWVVKLAQEA